jgi:hypothetical protein
MHPVCVSKGIFYALFFEGAGTAVTRAEHDLSGAKMLIFIKRIAQKVVP